MGSGAQLVLNPIAALLPVVQRADAVDDLQVVVLSEVEHETVGHRLDFAEATIDEHCFFAVVVTGADVGRVLHLALGAEGGHDATQAFCPVAGAKLASLRRQADDYEGGRFLVCHCSTMLGKALRPRFQGILAEAPKLRRDLMERSGRSAKRYRFAPATVHDGATQCCGNSRGIP